MEQLFERIDGYCERTDASYWSEPVNALTNLAFIVAAIVMWRRSEEPGGRVLSVILFAIGVGSWLFHTHATVWAAIMDVVLILVFTLTYIYLANRDFLGWPIWASAIGAALYIPYSAALGGVLRDVPGFNTSAEYWPLPVLILFYASLLSRRSPQVAKGLVIGALILCVSLAFRSVDQGVCDDFALGTHFMWHVLNGVMLGWMIEVRRRAVTRRPDAPR